MPPETQLTHAKERRAGTSKDRAGDLLHSRRPRGARTMGITQHRGRHTEALAAAYLELVGIRNAARNERIGGVEIDLVGHEGETIVLVEVKFRSRSDYGGAVHAVSGVQRGRLRRAARALQRGGTAIRIDVVAIDLEPEGLRLRHIRNAVTDGAP